MEPWDNSLLLGGGPQGDGSMVDMAGRGQEPASPALWSRESRRRRARRAAAAAAVLLLLLLAAATLLLVLVPGRKAGQLPHSQDTTPSPGNSSDVITKQHQAMEMPRAMLTAPRSINLSKEYLEWESEHGHVFCIGFNYSDGHLVVPRNGIYRVFLQITYEGGTDLQCSGDELKLTNIVWSLRISYTNDVHLLSSVDTVSCSMEHWHKSLYSSGMFVLEANTRLWVTASFPNLIVKTEYQTFFGAEFLPQ